MRSVRVSCQTMALYQGRPVLGFQTTVVSRWFVMPMAARSAAVRPALFERAGDRFVDAGGDLQGVVLDPAGLRQNLIVFDLVAGDLLAVAIEHHESRAGRSLIDCADVLLHAASLVDSGPLTLLACTVAGDPWSLTQDQNPTRVEAGADDAADQRADDGYPRILPVRAALAGYRQHGMRETWTEVAGWIDGVAGRATERDADAEHEHTDEQRLQAAAEDEGEIDVAGLRQRLRVGGDGKNAEEQHRGADDLGDQVRDRRPHRGPGAEDGQLVARSLRRTPMRQIREPDDDGSEERTDHLRREVGRHFGPGEAAGGGQGDRHGGIEVRATQSPDRVYRHRHRHAPADGDDDPAAVLALGPVQHHVGDDTIAQNDQEHRPQKFGQEGLHGAESSHARSDRCNAGSEGSWFERGRPAFHTIPEVARLDPLRSERFDVAIIGGGIIGCGIARDAALRGLRVALVDKQDFGGGTTAASTRIVHGGLRYLEMLDFRLVRLDLRERETLLRIAPHLVKPLEFLIPFFRGSLALALKMRVGLALYDALSYDTRLPSRRWLSREAASAADRALYAAQPTGAAAYHDARVDSPERLALENVLEAEQHHAVALNYCEAASITANGDRSLVRVRDVSTGPSADEYDVDARVVVNATGAWLETVTAALTGRRPGVIRTTKGVHLVCRALTDRPLVLFSGVDKRLLFAIPRVGLTWIGTTDTDFAGDPGTARADAPDVDYLLRSVQHVFPALGREDVLYTTAGVRALVKAGGSESSVSRMHHIVSGPPIAPPGVISVLGGKITGYRAIAEEVTDAVCRHLGATDRKCTTADTPLPGAAASRAEEGGVGADPAATSHSVGSLRQPVRGHHPAGPREPAPGSAAFTALPGPRRTGGARGPPGTLRPALRLHAPPHAARCKRGSGLGRGAGRGSDHACRARVVSGT